MGYASKLFINTASINTPHIPHCPNYFHPTSANISKISITLGESQMSPVAA
jgi:hypothetical protein